MQFRYFVFIYSSYIGLNSELFVSFIDVSMFLNDFVYANFLNNVGKVLKNLIDSHEKSLLSFTASRKSKLVFGLAWTNCLQR